MKRLFLLTICLLGVSALVAQDRYLMMEGVVMDAQGRVTYQQPHTTLAVDLTVEQEVILAGPYARYALKFLGLRAPFSDKSAYRLISATTALLDESVYEAKPLASASSEEYSYAGEADRFPTLSVDRQELMQPSEEQAAEQAAKRIFQLRRHRQDLITGEAGEHVFGEGLKAALEALDAQEQALLELFLGKRVKRTMQQRFILTPASDKRQYILCRFSEADGILSADDLSGEIVLLEITPGKAPYVEPAPEKWTEVARCRVAAPSECSVQSGGVELGHQRLPIFEFGESVQVALPRKK